jgi:nitroreductase
MIDIASQHNPEVPAPSTLRESPLAPRTINLVEPDLCSGVALMTALSFRHSAREFASQPIPERQLGELLWAAGGINRTVTGGRTVPTPRGCQDMTIYVALPLGVYRYEPRQHRLILKNNVDARSCTGYQDFVGYAPVDLVYVANRSQLADLTPRQRNVSTAATAGAIAQNVYLYCASSGLATVARSWFDVQGVSEAFGLSADEVPVLTQTVGMPVSART